MTSTFEQQFNLVHDDPVFCREYERTGSVKTAIAAAMKARTPTAGKPRQGMTTMSTNRFPTGPLVLSADEPAKRVTGLLAGERPMTPERKAELLGHIGHVPKPAPRLRPRALALSGGGGAQPRMSAARRRELMADAGYHPAEPLPVKLREGLDTYSTARLSQ